jgi:hypothetical protein
MSRANKHKKAASLCEVLEFCSKQLGLAGIACLAASSMELRKASLAAARSDAALLLIDTVKAAAAAAAFDNQAAESKQQRVRQHVKAVAWLLQVEPTAAKTAATAELLLHTPGLPLQMAEQLVASGVRVSYEQICTAASSMVAGVELWVKAHLNLGVTADIPWYAVMMCVPDLVSSQRHGIMEYTVYHPLCMRGGCPAPGLVLCSALSTANTNATFGRASSIAWPSENSGAAATAAITGGIYVSTYAIAH